MQGNGEKITPANCQESEVVQERMYPVEIGNLLSVWLRSLLVFFLFIFCFLSSLELLIGSIPRSGRLRLSHSLIVTGYYFPLPPNSLLVHSM